MPFELQFSPDGSLARVRGFGPEGFSSSMEAMRRIGEDPRLAPGTPVLMDIRELDYLATPPEVKEFASPGSMPALYAGHPVAILVRQGTQFGIARAFAARAEDAGAQMKVFVEERMALAWLAGVR